MSSVNPGNSNGVDSVVRTSHRIYLSTQIWYKCYAVCLLHVLIAVEPIFSFVYIWLSLLYPVSCLVLPINNSHPVIKQMTFWVILLDYFLSINMKIWLSSPVLCLVYISADIELYPWMLMSLTEKGIYKALHTYKSWRSLHMLMLLILCVAQLYKLPTSSCALLHSIFTHKVLYSTFLNDKVKVKVVP